MRLLQETEGGEESCVYLPEETSRTQYRIIDQCTPEAYEEMLFRGWRRFGRVFFRPICAHCTECLGLRVPVEDFNPDRSMRRNRKRNQDLRAILQPVSLSATHLELYDRYHRDMADRKGWKGKGIDPIDYYQTFVDGHQDFGHELLLVADNRLVGVALVDLLPTAISAVYCFYDPEERQRGLGVFSVLQQIEFAKKRKIPHVFLGFWIEGNTSMRYKANYRPHEILQGRPDFEEEPLWQLGNTHHNR